MNKLEILNMEAGFDLDKLVDENIFNRKLPVLVYRGDVLMYSSSWALVKSVVDKMNEDGFTLELIIGADGNTMATLISISGDNIHRYSEIVCATVPEAICKAALLTKVVA